MSGTSNVLPLVAVAQKTASCSKAVHPKMRTLQSMVGPREPIPDDRGRSIASNNGKDSMETHLEGRIHTADRQSWPDGTSSQAESKDPRQVAFNDVLNQKMTKKEEASSDTAEGNAENGQSEENKLAEEFIFSPFIHTANTKSAENTQADTATQQQPAEGQLLVQPQTGSEGNTEKELSPLMEGSKDGQKGQFQQVTSQMTDTNATVNEAAKPESQPSDGQQVTNESKMVSDLSAEGKHGKAELQQSASDLAQNTEKTTTDQGIPVETKEASVKQAGQKEVLASEALEEGVKVDKTAEDQKISASDAPVKAIAGPDKSSAKQMGHTSQEQFGQTESNESPKTGFKVENTEIEVAKSDFSASKAGIADSNLHAQGHQPDHIGMDVQEPGMGISSNASAQAVQATEKVAGAMDAVTAKPIDQIIQQLNVSYSGTDQQIRLTLTPEDLGTVRVTFRQMEGEVVGMVEVQKEQTRKEVEEALPQLVSAMQENGIQVRKVEVVQWNNPDQQQSKQDSSDGFSLSQEREFAQQTSQGSSNSSGSGSGRSSHGQGNSTQTGGISLEEMSDSGQIYSKKGLNFLV